MITWNDLLNDAAGKEIVDNIPKVLKEKKGVPTVIEWQGKKYVLHHSDQFKR